MRLAWRSCWFEIILMQALQYFLSSQSVGRFKCRVCLVNHKVECPWNILLSYVYGELLIRKCLLAVKSNVFNSNIITTFLFHNYTRTSRKDVARIHSFRIALTLSQYD